MLFNISLLEWIGYLASIIVAISLTMSSIKKLRWLNLWGSAVFSFYGFAIGALPVGLLNSFMVFVNVYYLIKMNSSVESFKTLQVPANDPYFNYFIDFHKKEIQEIFPNFDLSLLQNEGNNRSLSLLILRNAIAAGVFYGTIEDNALYVHIDFVTAEYRDLKPGEYIYKKNVQQLKDFGIQRIISKSDYTKHQKYLLKMGFVSQIYNPSVFVKEI
ncbi:MAG TPA: hypothetical protein PK296_02230 [Paludibacteraceae bacterium]|nr:hypothetical protein [Paludibacteraceae bacterium]HOV84508.1 hypothetical protein [Paludibacteraceae bacterium]